MKKYLKLFLIAIIPFLNNVSFSQNKDSTQLNDTTLTIDALTSPSSPASVLLGVNPSDIQKPTDLTGIWTSVRNATNDFSSFPTSFAIDIAPKWVFGKKNITYDDFVSNKKVLGQTFNFSYSQVSQNDSNYVGLKQGIGVSFSLIRGSIKDKNYLSIIDSIHNQLSELVLAGRNKLSELIANDSDYQNFEKSIQQLKDENRIIKNSTQQADIDRRKTIRDSILIIQTLEQKKLEELRLATKVYVDSINSARIESLKSFEKDAVPVRKGLFLNFSAGTIVKYNNFQANASSLTNESAWLNFGYDGLNTDSLGKSYLSFIFLARLIADNTDELYKSGLDKTYTTGDAGLRIAFTTNNQKLSFSGEAIARKLWDAQNGNAWVNKYLLNIDVQVSKNQRLTFSYGKDFQNHITRDGNVIGYINYAAGLFNQKKFTSK